MYHCECSAEGCGLRHLRVLIDVGMVVKPVALDEWRDELEQLQDRLGELFVRPEPRQQAGFYLEALLSSAERKNGWQLAEQIGDVRPWRTQRVLSDALWSQDKARALCRSYVIEHLGAPDGVLVVDETGFLKKGTQSVGVARQYSQGNRLNGKAFRIPSW
jgi:SRSO17 transposase